MPKTSKKKKTQKKKKPVTKTKKVSKAKSVKKSKPKKVAAKSSNSQQTAKIPVNDNTVQAPSVTVTNLE